MHADTRSKLDSLFRLPTGEWKLNEFNKLNQAKDGSQPFGVLLDWEEQPPVGARISVGRPVNTNLFESKPIWWDHGDGEHVVLGWMVTPVVMPSQWNARFVSCKRSGFPDAELEKSMRMSATATISSLKAREVMQKAMTSLPQPEVTAALHGLLILEVGDVGGIALISKNADLKI